MEEASKFGQIFMKRIYGNWNSEQMKGWRDKLQEYALTPVQVFPNIVGKNATDSYLIIDVMDVLHDDVVDGFCIASSDSDFTNLALRVKEHGKFVLGLGSQRTHKSFKNACTRFIHIENITKQRAPAKAPARPPAKTKMASLEKMLATAFDNVVTNDGFAHLSKIVEYLYKVDPSFDMRDYKVNQAIKLIELFPDRFSVKSKGHTVIVIMK